MMFFFFFYFQEFFKHEWWWYRNRLTAFLNGVVLEMTVAKSRRCNTRCTQPTWYMLIVMTERCIANVPTCPACKARE